MMLRVRVPCFFLSCQISARENSTFSKTDTGRGQAASSTSLTLTKPRALIGLHSFPDHKTHGLGCQFSLSFHLHLALPWYHILTECLSMPGFLYFWGCFFMSLALLLNKEGRKRKAGLCPPNIIPASRTGSSWAGLSLFADIHQCLRPNMIE